MTERWPETLHEKDPSVQKLLRACSTAEKNVITSCIDAFTKDEIDIVCLWYFDEIDPRFPLPIPTENKKAALLDMIISSVDAWV